MRMTIHEALKKYYNIEIELLLAHVLKKPKEFLYLHPDKSLSAYQIISLLALAKRRMGGEPIAYILGYKDFYGNRFKVDRNVLVPRPETEMGVDLALDVIARTPSEPASGGRVEGDEANLPKEKIASESVPVVLKRIPRNDRIKILDVGTGSGCIIISLAKSLSAKPLALSPIYYASDISQKALAVAKQNAKNILYHHTRLYECKIKFIQSDLLDKIKFNPEIIIANLPYLAPQWKSKSIKHEPKQALFTKEKGLYLYRKLLDQISTLNPRPSLIFLEFDPRQKADLGKLIKKYLPEGDIAFHRDFNGLWRYAGITIN